MICFQEVGCYPVSNELSDKFYLEIEKVDLTQLESTAETLDQDFKIKSGVY